MLLAGTIGLPFVVLSSTASMLQHWFSRTNHPAARDPYFLYVASNLGSLLALAVVSGTRGAVADARRAEPRMGRRLCGLRRPDRRVRVHVVPAASPGSASTSRLSPAAREDARPVSIARRARWVAASFVPSSLMLAVTSYLSTDIAAVPLLWILPLACTCSRSLSRSARKRQPGAALAERTVPCCSSSRSCSS